VENVANNRSPAPADHSVARKLPPDHTLGGLAVLGFGGICLGAVLNLTSGELGIPCLLRSTTGLDCPFCGTTRMMGSLLQGDVLAALRFNAPVLVGSVVLGYLWLSWVLERFGLLRLWRPRLPARLQRSLFPVFAVLAVVFMVLRNLPFAPFSALYV
jgi:Protein of unknown function (DUF2752)